MDRSETETQSRHSCIAKVIAHRSIWTQNARESRWYLVIRDGIDQGSSYMDKQDLIAAIGKSGGKQRALDEADDLWARIDCLSKAGRYDRLVSSLTKANNKSNFLALVLETNFAYQFESQGLDLTYEVQQGSKNAGSIDFLRRRPNGDNVYFEVRLLQQALTITESIKAQLLKSQMYHYIMGWQDEQHEVIRLQNTILGKVQDKNGTPIKFFSTDANVVNIVVVDTTDSTLGTTDLHDCKLVTHGDPDVEEVYRRRIFGLFQETRPEYPRHIQELAVRYAHIRRTLHGVLFLFKKPNTGEVAPPI